MVETYLENSDDGMSKLDSPILLDKGPFSALRDSLPSMEPARTNVQEANPGVAPMLVNSRATSLALRSGMSTPVPLPVDRLKVPPADSPALENREPTSNPERTSPSPPIQAPRVDNQQLEMYINMFHAQRSMYEAAQPNNNIVVMRAALLQAVSSQELISRMLNQTEMMEVCGNWLADLEVEMMESRQRALERERTVSNSEPTSTPARIPPSRQTSPQKDATMAYQAPTPVQLTAHIASSNSSAPRVVQNPVDVQMSYPEPNPGLYVAQDLVQTLNPPALPSVQNLTNAQTTNVAANYAPYANQNAMNYPTYTAQNAVNYPAYTAQNVMNYPVHTVQDAVNVQAPNFVPNYVTPSQQIPNQATYEHPRPPQHQQGLPGTSHQAGPISISRPVHRTQRDRFHHNRNEPAAPQPHPPPQQRPTPYPVQHQPGGNSGGSRRRRRNHQPQDNTARVLEVGDVFLRAERILGRMQRVQGRKNAQNRNHQ
ncbi:hypothetical protein PSTG_17609 [Puccinia striiformis f. sp. tritici PST-78]|uniref:Uncharacterized protein n=1 Tax=Puccinia striiformis f. sp. tritici PST-78 TaxID=1165861 RepID=A0A0L0UPN8_9BASI|nr:hypothetical protein PSTG_17609 [Puccinia striiformis f. sp. tritici PST-78]